MPPRPQPDTVTGFDHVSLPMHDDEAMVAFYRALGFLSLIHI